MVFMRKLLACLPSDDLGMPPQHSARVHWKSARVHWKLERADKDSAKLRVSGIAPNKKPDVITA